MPVAKRLRHQVAAHRDLLDIWTYTRSIWGEEQADAYLTDISRVLSSIAAGDLTGSRHEYGYMKRRVQAHVIYFKETAREIVVVRVLHGRMDPERHLRR